MIEGPRRLPARPRRGRISLFATTDAPVVHLAAYLAHGPGFNLSALANPAQSTPAVRAERAAIALLRRRPVAIAPAPHDAATAPGDARASQPDAARLSATFFSLREQLQHAQQWGPLHAADAQTALGAMWQVYCARVACAVGGLEYAAYAACDAPGVAAWGLANEEAVESAWRDLMLFASVVAESNCRLWAMGAAARLVARKIKQRTDFDVVQAMDASTLDPSAEAIVAACEPANEREAASAMPFAARWQQWLEVQKTLVALQREQTEHWIRQHRQR